MKIILAGGTGFIGKKLTERLVQEKHEVILLTRNPKRALESVRGTIATESWDGENLGSWGSQLNGADAIVNLSGEPIFGKRWSESQKKKIVDSRIQTTRLLVRAMSDIEKKPSVLINASAVGFYGDDFLAMTCKQWEGEAKNAEKLGVRIVCLRMGIVIDKEGGALQKMIPSFKMFVGGVLGSGKQWFPWIHRDDVVEIILFAIKGAKLSGPVNVVAPDLKTVKEFCDALGKAMHRPSWLHVPSVILRLSLGEMANVLLGGQHAVPKKLVEAGYKFKYSELNQALGAAFFSSAFSSSSSKGTSS